MTKILNALYDKSVPKTMFIAGKLIVISGDEQDIEFIVMDYDKRSADDIIGKCKIEWSLLRKRRDCKYEITLKNDDDEDSGNLVLRTYWEDN